MTILWDQSKIHERSGVVKEYLAKHPEIVTEDFPGYAPDANPDEGVWGYTKYHRLPNYAPEAPESYGSGCATSYPLCVDDRTCWPRSSGMPESLSNWSSRPVGQAGLSNSPLLARRTPDLEIWKRKDLITVLHNNHYIKTY